MASTEMQYVIFRLNGESYGIEIKYVETIEKIMEITRVPKTSNYIKGVINLRGEIVPVIDVKERFNLGSSGYDSEARIIVNKIDDMLIGFIVDSASEVKNISQENVNYNIVDESFQEGFVKGIAKHQNKVIILVDIDKILNLNHDISQELEGGES